jgi:peptidyl-prolyl cis-trans isomerase C
LGAFVVKDVAESKTHGLKRKFRQASAALLLTGSAAFFLSGCSPEPTVDLAPAAVPLDKTVVTVNGEPLSLDEFDSEFRLMQIYYSAVTEGDMRTIKRRLFEQVINRRILVQEARKIGLKMTQKEVDETFREALREGSEDFSATLKSRGVNEQSWKWKFLREKLARKLVDQEVNAKVQITPEEVEEHYWSHLSEYWKPEAVRARHLVVQRKNDLEKVLNGLQKGEDFPRITSTFSAGMEKAQGGDWGFMDSDRLSSAYLKVLRSLKPGEISKPLKDEFGYHLFQLIEWRPRRMRSFAEAKEKIRDSLLKEEQDLRFDQWMAGLKKKATIKVNREMALIVGVTLEGLREE